MPVIKLIWNPIRISMVRQEKLDVPTYFTDGYVKY